MRLAWRAVRPVVRPACLAPQSVRWFQASPALAAKAAKGGKKKKKKIEKPAGLTAANLAEDWSKWKHGEKIDITMPWKTGEEPAWLKEILATVDKDGFINWTPKKAEGLHDVDPYKHGLKYTYRRLRRARIKDDNLLRSWGKFNWTATVTRSTLKRPRVKPKRIIG